MITQKQIFAIGADNGLQSIQLKNFVAFIQKRFPQESHVDYISEWAIRFRDSMEWFRSDSKSRAILMKINKKYYTEFQKDLDSEWVRMKGDVSQGFLMNWRYRSYNR